MERYVSSFLRAALLWLVAGTFLGATMAAHPAWVVYRPAHAHALLLGFVMMFIAGVAYHVIPRFAMAPLRSPRLAVVHLVLANLGLGLLVAGFIGRVRHPQGWLPVLSVGGICSLVALWLFAWNIWRTLDRAAPIPARMPTARPLPTTPR
jgi:cbb3-type cytochrome oxidase subunit 1